jgi:hypothetical protein
VLAVICGILIIALLASTAFYASILNDKDCAFASLNSTIADKDEEISSLTTEEESLQNQLDNLTSEMANLQSQVDSLTSENLSNYQSIGSQLSYLQSQPIPQLSTSQVDSSDQQPSEEFPPTSQIIIESVNFTYEKGEMLHRLVTALVTNVVVKNLGAKNVVVTSIKLYYSGELQASKAVSVIIPSNSTRNIETHLAPRHWGSAGGNLYFVTVETKQGYTATSDPILLLGIPPF